MKKHLAALAALTVSLGLVSGTPSQARVAAGEWQEGRSDSDTIINCPTSTPGIGISGNVGWRSDDGQVPEVGEVFTLRGYVGVVSLPCSGKALVLPEILVPLGIEFADGPVVWDHQAAGEAQDLGTDPLTFARGLNDGIVIQEADESAFELRRGEILEFQFPVYATRELKGPATQRPECQDRIDGEAPCPVTQAGDHFQMAFTVAGHGGDKSYVTPYVGLFAQEPGGNGGGGGEQPASPVASTTKATYAVSSRKAGTARVSITSSKPVVGKVVVLDGGRTIGRAEVRAAQNGTITVRLPRLAKGKHRLVTKFLGSRTVRASASAPRTVTVR